MVINSKIQSMLAVLLAGVFVAAAIAKLIYFTFPSGSSVTPMWISMGAAFVELVLAWNLVVTGLRNDATLIATSTFVLALLCVSIFYLANGIKCNCLGTLQIPLFMTVASNLFVSISLIALVYHRKFTWDIELRHELTGAFVGCVLAFLLGVAFSFPPLNNLVGLQNNLTNRVNVVLEDSILSGEVSAGESIDFVVAVHNQSDSTVEIVGGGSSCGCVTLQSIPISIRPQETAHLNISVFAGDEVGEFTRRIEYYLSSSRQFSLPLSVSYNVVAK